MVHHSIFLVFCLLQLSLLASASQRPVEPDGIKLEQKFGSNAGSTSGLSAADTKHNLKPKDDNGSPSTTNSTDKILLIVKSNRDGAPQFTQPHYQAFVNENQPIGEPFFSVRAVIPNDKSSQPRYSMGYDLNDMIIINPLNGELSFKTRVDFDDFNGLPYNITVLATDNSKPYPLETSASVSILIQDINNKSPRFTQKEYKSTLVQDQTKPGESILQVSATDSDKNANLDYSLVPDQMFVTDRNGQLLSIDEIENSTTGYIAHMNKLERANLVSGLMRMFQINRKSGVIHLRTEPDYSFASIITITARVRDLNQQVFPASGELQQDFVKCNFFLQIVTNRSPIFAPPWSIQKQDYNLSMFEELAVGTPIFSLLAKDPMTNQRIDIFEKVYETDPKDLFRVDRSGYIYVNKRIDFEELDKSKRLSFSVKALTNDIFFSIANLHIQVIDLNDNAPQFKNQNISVSISENATYPQEVATVSAVDKDSNEFGQVYYYLTGHGNESFVIDSRKGVISLRERAKLDRETEPNYLLLVTAADCNGTKLTLGSDLVSAVSTSSLDSNVRPGCKRSTAFVNVKLLDENDNDPVFLNVNERGELVALTAETVSVGSILTQALATDADEDTNGYINYEIIRGDDPISGALSIDQDGYVSVATSLAGLGRSTPYKVLIRAIDQGAPSRNSLVTLLLTVSDVVSNDGVPRFIRPTAGEFISVSESAGPSTFVYQVKAVDPDEDSNGKIMYKLVQPSDVFEIDPFSGIIKTQLRSSFYLDREQVSNYTLVVLAQDLGTPPKQAHQVLKIHVTDVNDNEPYFDRQVKDPPMVLYVEEEVPVGTLVGTVRAIDLDDGQNALVGYEIIEGNTNNLFELHFGPDEFNSSVASSGEASSCKIYTNGRLDRETRESYTLTIKANSLAKVRHPFIQKPLDPLGGRNTLNQYNATDLTKLQVVIKILDINDNRPVFSEQNPKSVVDSLAEIYSQLLVFNATDVDSSSSDIHYSILDVLHYPDAQFRYGESLDLFGIEPRLMQGSVVQPVSMRYAFDIDSRLGILRNSISLQPYVNDYFEVFVKAESGVSAGTTGEDISTNGLLNGLNPEYNRCAHAETGSDLTSDVRRTSNSTPYADMESCSSAISKAVVFVTHHRDTFRFVFNKTKLSDRLDEFKSKLQGALEEMILDPSHHSQASSVGEKDAPLPFADRIFLNIFNTDFYEREDGSLDFSTLTSCSQLVKFEDRSLQTKEDVPSRYMSLIGGNSVPNQVMSYNDVMGLLKALNGSQTGNHNSNGGNKSSLFNQYGLVSVERCQLGKTSHKMSIIERTAIYFAICTAVIGSLLALIVSKMRKSYERNLRLLQRSKYQYMNQPYANLASSLVAIGARPSHHMSLGTLPGATNLISPHYGSQLNMGGDAFHTWQL